MHDSAIRCVLAGRIGKEAKEGRKDGTARGLKRKRMRCGKGR